MLRCSTAAPGPKPATTVCPVATATDWAWSAAS